VVGSDIWRRRRQRRRQIEATQTAQSEPTLAAESEV
jgi:hypothetical protein